MVIVAYIGNFLPEHSTETHVAKALENLGHEVRRIPEQRLDWSELAGLVKGSDLCMWTRTGAFDPADHEGQRLAWKSLDVPTVSYHLDRWWGLRRETTERGPRDSDPSPFFFSDWIFTADGGHQAEWESIGANHVWMPPGILSDEVKRVGVWRQEFDASVGFVGNLRRYGHPEWGPYRYKLYKFLVRTYGKRFKLWEGGIRGQDLADLYASVKVLVGDSCLAGGVTRYWSDRIPETLGRGGFLIHPWVEGLPIEHPILETYPLGDFGKLGDLIDFWLSRDRSNEQKTARQHTLENHTYEHRLERVLATVLS